MKLYYNHFEINTFFLQSDWLRGGGLFFQLHNRTTVKPATFEVNFICLKAHITASKLYQTI